MQTLSNSGFNKIRHCVKKTAFWFLLEKRLTDSVHGSETSPADHTVRLKTDPQVVGGRVDGSREDTAAELPNQWVRLCSAVANL